jgi:hypothetical protein
MVCDLDSSWTVTKPMQRNEDARNLSPQHLVPKFFAGTKLASEILEFFSKQVVSAAFNLDLTFRGGTPLG